jgi:hypothetical protein
MGRLEAEPLVETVRLGSGLVRRELNPVTPALAGLVYGGAHQDGADTVSPLIGVHVHRLDLGTETAPVLEMAKDDELADSDDLITDVRHQHGAGPPDDLGQRSPIRGEIVRILLPRHERSVGEELHNARDVHLGGFPDDHLG